MILIAVPWPTLPTEQQARHIAELRRLAGTRTIIDATPVPDAADRSCDLGWRHGPGLYRLSSGDVACLVCAVDQIRPGPGQVTAHATVEILREPVEAVSRWWQMVPDGTGDAL